MNLQDMKTTQSAFDLAHTISALENFDRNKDFRQHVAGAGRKLASNYKLTSAFDVLERLACPRCLAALVLEHSSVVRVVCGHRYPIVNGIPILVLEAAYSD